ncbi:MAG: SpoIID/LytB domain-containing protein [Oscillospiraceae bacterium]|nr:SpoIID/LytB domain-containing protein [Oscillospiraceae bacterium]
MKVGLCYGGTAQSSAVLENDIGSGFLLGWFDEGTLSFHQTASVEEKKIAIALRSGEAVVSSAANGKVLFRFIFSGGRGLGVMPDGRGEKAQTRFNGSRWYGGFEFRRSGNGLSVINIVPLEDYIKGVLPYEMSSAWPLEALKAQAVCARTYALLPSRHYGAEGFDVCNTTCCQVYRGIDQSGPLSDQAVEETAGVTARYNGQYAETYYYSSNGGASESAVNVWGNQQPYLIGKPDPYEALTSIPNYEYTISYSWKELTSLLKTAGYSIGTVTSAQITKTTPTGNASEVTFRDASGRKVVLTNQDCRWTLGANSTRFTISDDGGTGWSVNPSGGKVSSLSDTYAVSGSGLVGTIGSGTAYVITASGTSALQPSGGGSGITITGTGWGHGVGMSQYGAKAMAEQGYSYEDILQFYYTGITLDRAARS